MHCILISCRDSGRSAVTRVSEHGKDPPRPMQHLSTAGHECEIESDTVGKEDNFCSRSLYPETSLKFMTTFATRMSHAPSRTHTPVTKKNPTCEVEREKSRHHGS